MGLGVEGLIPPLPSSPPSVVLASSNDHLAGVLLHLDSAVCRFYIISMYVLPLWKTSLHQLYPKMQCTHESLFKAVIRIMIWFLSRLQRQLVSCVFWGIIRSACILTQLMSHSSGQSYSSRCSYSSA